MCKLLDSTAFAFVFIADWCFHSGGLKFFGISLRASSLGDWWREGEGGERDIVARSLSSSSPPPPAPQPQESLLAGCFGLSTQLMMIMVIIDWRIVP